MLVNFSPRQSLLRHPFRFHLSAPLGLLRKAQQRRQHAEQQHHLHQTAALARRLLLPISTGVITLTASASTGEN